MEKKLSKTNDGVVPRSYHRPPKPPMHHKSVKSQMRPRDINSDAVKDQEGGRYGDEQHNHRTEQTDHVFFNVYEKGVSKKQHLYKGVQKLRPQRGDGPPYKTLPPDEESKHVSYTGCYDVVYMPRGDILHQNNY